MIRIFAITILLFSTEAFSSCSGKEEKTDCSQLKTGKFEYRNGTPRRHYQVVRNDSVQVEKDEESGFEMKFKIDWISPCEYTLTDISYKIKGKESLVNPGESHAMKTIILKVTKNYYVCRSVVEGETLAVVDTMLIQK